MVNLPVKTKNLQNGIFEFIRRSEVISEEVKRSLYQELPFLKTVGEQKTYYANLLSNEEEIEKNIKREKETKDENKNKNETVKFQENSEVKVISLQNKINYAVLEIPKNENDACTTTKKVIIINKKKKKKIKKKKK